MAPPDSGDRLDGWKEIARRLDRSVRSVQRWEKEENLPVHRHFHHNRETVWADPAELNQWLASRRVNRSGQRPSRNFDVYRLCVEGRHHWDRRTRSALAHSIDCFERSSELEPGYAPALAGLADAHNMLAYYSYEAPAETFAAATQAADRALEMEPDSAEALSARAFIAMFFEWEWELAAGGFRKALEIEPSNAVAHYWFGLNLGVRGKLYEAIEQVRVALELEPISPVVNTYVAGALYLARQHTQATAKCRQTLDLHPDFFPAQLMLGNSLIAERRYPEAREILKRAVSGSEGCPDALAALGLARGLAGDTDAANEVLEELADGPHYASLGHQARVHLGLGDLDKAMDCLERAVPERFPGLALMRSDPVLDPIREDARFQKILEEVGPH